jgi:CubicO group peptidase (beta-lactamase class C family)
MTGTVPSSDLPSRHWPLPPHPRGTVWPSLTWSTGEAPDPDRLDDVLDAAFEQNPNPTLALSLACVVVHRGRIVGERYGPVTTARSRLLSWSIAKSVTQLALGVAVHQGLVDLDISPVADEWADPSDPRHAISLRALLQMRDGLQFVEDYSDLETCNCLAMLFGPGADDVAAYAAARPLAAGPGGVFNYSSGSTNLIARVLRQSLGGTAEALDRFLVDEVLGPLGIEEPDARFDAAGNWIASSYLYLRAREFARIGELALRDGVWDGRRLVPEGWIDRGRTAISADPEEPIFYGEHWWVYDDPWGTFAAKGYEGQAILVVPGLDLVIARLGKTPKDHRPALESWYREVIDCFVPLEPARGAVGDADPGSFASP